MGDVQLDLQFTGDIWHWRGPSPFYFVTVPEDAEPPSSRRSPGR